MLLHVFDGTGSDGVRTAVGGGGHTREYTSVFRGSGFLQTAAGREKKNNTLGKSVCV